MSKLREMEPEDYIKVRAFDGVMNVVFTMENDQEKDEAINTILMDAIRLIKDFQEYKC